MSRNMRPCQLENTKAGGYLPITLDEAADYLRKNLIPEKMCSSGISIWVVNTNWEGDPEKVTPEAVIVVRTPLYNNLSWQISLRLSDIICKDKKHLWYRRVNIIEEKEFEDLLSSQRQIKNYDPDYNFLFGERRCIWSPAAGNYVVAHIFPQIFSPIEEKDSWQRLERIDENIKNSWLSPQEEKLDFVKAFPSLDACRSWINDFVSSGRWQAHLNRNGTNTLLPDWTMMLPAIIACDFNQPNENAYLRLEPAQIWYFNSKVNLAFSAGGRANPRKRTIDF